MRMREWEACKGCLVLCLVAIVVFAGCSSDKSTNTPNGGNDPGDTQGKYLIEAYFGNEMVSEGTFSAYVERMEDSDAAATECTFTINGTNIPLVPLMSTPSSAFFTKLNFGYQPGSSYTVTAALAGKTATCTFVAPVSVYPEITAPVRSGEGSFTPGQPIDLAWTYDPEGVPEKIYIGVSPVSMDGSDDEEVLYEQEQTGATVTHRIPGATTGGWDQYDQVMVTVDLGERAWPMTGQLPYVGSFVVTVLPGTAVILNNATGEPSDEWTLTLTVYPEAINADGESTTQAEVHIWNQDSEPCPDGTSVTLEASPTGYVTLEPQTLTTLGGTATATIRAGNQAGSVSITASAELLGTEAPAPLTLQEVVVRQITVGAGAHPTISWTPADGMLALVVTAAGAMIGAPVWSIAPTPAVGARVNPPVTYGTTPSGCIKVYPYLGSPDPLVPGNPYKVWLVTALGDTLSQTFTP
jgi:hypothetical protein